MTAICGHNPTPRWGIQRIGGMDLYADRASSDTLPCMDLSVAPLVPRFLSVLIFISAVAKPVSIALAWSWDIPLRRSVVLAILCLFAILLGGVIFAASNYLRFAPLARRLERAARADGTVSEEDLAGMRHYFLKLPIWGDAWAKVSKTAWGFAFFGPLIYWITGWAFFDLFDISFVAWLILLGGFALTGLLTNGLGIALMGLEARRGERELEGAALRNQDDL